MLWYSGQHIVFWRRRSAVQLSVKAKIIIYLFSDVFAPVQMARRNRCTQRINIVTECFKHDTNSEGDM